MPSLLDLWWPIVACAFALFATSLALWAVLPHHRSDYRALPDEDRARRALAGPELTPGLYNIPNVPSLADLRDPAVAAKFTVGPVGFLTVLPNRLPRMGRNSMHWLAWLLVVSTAVALLASRALPIGADDGAVFVVTAIATGLAFGAGIGQDAAWYGRPWIAVIKQVLDAAVLGAVSGAVFSWGWPA
ncbi:MAG: hypothetical protein AAF628_07515 [Planctomycetota bacterium]